MRRHNALKIIIAAALIAFARPTQPASAEAGSPMDIREAISLMLSNNLTLKSIALELDKAEAFRIQADGTRAPEAGLSAMTDETRARGESSGSNQIRLSVSQTLYSGGKNRALRKQAPRARGIAELSLADARNRAAGELFARFYNVLLQERRIEAERSAVSTSEIHLREVEKMSELGLSNRLEVIRASQQLAANRAGLVAADGLYDSAVISLMNYLAIPPDERRPASGDLRALAVSGDRAQSMASAMDNRADLGALAHQMEYQRIQIEIERSAYRPKLTLGGSAAFVDQGRGGSFDDTWRAELSLTVPILDRNASRGNVMRAEATAAQDEIALEQKTLDIKSGVETAWTELETAREHLASAARALELAGETLRLAEVGYREGVTPQLDLLSAQTSLTASRQEHLRSLYNHMLAVVALKVTEGNIIEWAEGMDF